MCLVCLHVQPTVWFGPEVLFIVSGSRTLKCVYLRVSGATLWCQLEKCECWKSLRRGWTWEQVLSQMQGKCWTPFSLFFVFFLFSCQERHSWWMTSCAAVLFFLSVLSCVTLPQSERITVTFYLECSFYLIVSLCPFWSTLVPLLSHTQRKQGWHSWRSKNENSDPLSLLI